jgi:hypothetical protein
MRSNAMQLNYFTPVRKGHVAPDSQSLKIDDAARKNGAWA